MECADRDWVTGQFGHQNVFHPLLNKKINVVVKFPKKATQKTFGIFSKTFLILVVDHIKLIIVSVRSFMEYVGSVHTMSTYRLFNDEAAVVGVVASVTFVSPSLVTEKLS